MRSVLTTWVVWKHVMKKVHLKSNPGLPWHKPRSARRRIFVSKLNLNLRKELVKCYNWDSFVRCCYLDTSESSSEITWMFEMWSWRWMEIWWKERNKNEGVWQRVREETTILHRIKRRRADWTSGILRRNCLLRHVLYRKIRGLGWWGRKPKQLLDDLKATKM